MGVARAVLAVAIATCAVLCLLPARVSPLWTLALLGIAASMLFVFRPSAFGLYESESGQTISYAVGYWLSLVACACTAIGGVLAWQRGEPAA